MNHNHANYQRRMDFIHSLLKTEFNIEHADVSTVEYDDGCPFKYNNFVYCINFSVALEPIIHKNAGKLGCIQIPAGASQLIMRLTNADAEGMSTNNRVENEVAVMSLASKAMESMSPAIVPAVYGWGSASKASCQGWILQQFMLGTPISKSFKVMEYAKQKSLLSQIAQILKALQSLPLPPTITSFGGLTFDPAGSIISAPMPSVDKGPWTTFQESFEERIKVALGKADASKYIGGWRANGIRQRLDNYLEVGLAAHFKHLSLPGKLCIVHADFTASNMLYDPSSNKITALLDYDFSCIMHPSYEFLRSFDGIGGALSGRAGDETGKQSALSQAKISGFPEPLPPSLSDGINWQVSKSWEEELERFDVLRPSTIKGIDGVAEADGLLRSILPWRLSNSDILALQDEETILQYREECEENLMKQLGRLGY